jgi:hypothetical protein
LDTDRARGRSFYEPAAQAAEIFLLQQGYAGGELVGLRQGQDDQSDMFECLFLEDENTISVKLRKSASSMEIIASCGESETKTQNPFEMLSVGPQ